MVEMGVEAALAEEALQATHWNTDRAQEWLIMRHTAAQSRTSTPPLLCCEGRVQTSAGSDYISLRCGGVRRSGGEAGTRRRSWI